MRYYKFIPLIFLLPVAMLVNSCEEANEDAPQYVRINNFTLTTTPAQGSTSNKIVDGWVYLDGKLLGIFQLPTTIPALGVGSHTITIDPGVTNSGVESARLAYPFFEPYVATFTFVQGDHKTLIPTTRYRSNTEFKLNEGFEDGIPFEKGENSDTAMMRTDDPAIVFEGNYSGAMIISGTDDILTVKSKNSYPFTGANSEIYIELNYMSNCDLDVGIIGTATGHAQSISGFFSTGGVWKKTYIELSSTIHTIFTSDSDFKLYFKIDRAGDRSKDYKVYVDNLKLVNNK